VGAVLIPLVLVVGALMFVSDVNGVMFPGDVPGCAFQNIFVFLFAAVAAILFTFVHWSELKYPCCVKGAIAAADSNHTFDPSKVRISKPDKGSVATEMKRHSVDMSVRKFPIPSPTLKGEGFPENSGNSGNRTPEIAERTEENSPTGSLIHV